MYRIKWPNVLHPGGLQQQCATNRPTESPTSVPDPHPRKLIEPFITLFNPPSTLRKVNSRRCIELAVHRYGMGGVHRTSGHLRQNCSTHHTHAHTHTMRTRQHPTNALQMARRSTGRGRGDSSSGHVVARRLSAGNTHGIVMASRIDGAAQSTCASSASHARTHARTHTHTNTKSDTYKAVPVVTTADSRTFPQAPGIGTNPHSCGGHTYQTNVFASTSPG